jgi:hypothetical protein
VKRIRWANIEYLTLCPKGKNKLKVLYKEDGKLESTILIKSISKGEILAAVCIPDFLDEDEHIISDLNAIKSIAYSHAKNGSKLDLRHDGKPLSSDQAFVAESFVIQKSDPRFLDLKDDVGNKIDPTGGWGVIIKVDDPELQAKYESGEWQGTSMFGTAIVETIAKEQKHMDETKFVEILNKMFAPILTALTTISKALEPESKPEPKSEKKSEPEKKLEPEFDPTKPPIFKGNPLSKKDVADHQKALLRHEILKSVDFSDPEAVEKLAETLEKEKIEIEPESGDARMKAQLARLKKSSKLSPGVESGDNADNSNNLFQAGKKAGQYINGQSGSAAK